MKRLLLLLMLLTGSVACLNDVDFDQDDSYEVVVPYKIAFVYFETINSDFLDNNDQVTQVTQEFYPNIDDLWSRIYSDITIEFEINNSFLSGFNITYEFRDATSVIHAFTLKIDGNSSHAESVVIPSSIFTQTQKIIVTITPHNTTLTGKLNKLSLKSSLSFDVKY